MKSKLQTEMKLSQEEMGLALQDVLQEKEILEIRGNGKRDIESMIVENGQQAYDADLKECSRGRIAEDGVEKNTRIRNHMSSKTTKEEKEDDNHKYIYVYDG